VLTLLKISGFALIDEAEIAFGPGLTAVTGETGAGKSILVEALGLLRGGRAGADLIRGGRDEARVEAIVELPEASAARARLLADGRAYEDGLVVRRTIARGGRGRAHLGGSLATAADLGALVGPLIDIASQHDQQSLTDPESQLAILDAFAENASLRDEMAAAYAAQTAAAATLAAFSADARARAEREDLLRFQLGELEAARPVPGEEQALAAERERLRGAEKFYGATAGGEETLYAGDGAVSERIAAVLRDLEPLAALDPALAPQVERLSEAAAAIDDVAATWSRWPRWTRRSRRRSNGSPRRRRRSTTWRATWAATRGACAPIPRVWRNSRSASSFCRACAASTAALSPTSPRAATRSPPSWRRWRATTTRWRSVRRRRTLRTGAPSPRRRR